MHTLSKRRGTDMIGNIGLGTLSIKRRDQKVLVDIDLKAMMTMTMIMNILVIPLFKKHSKEVCLQIKCKAVTITMTCHLKIKDQTQCQVSINHHNLITN